MRRVLDQARRACSSPASTVMGAFGVARLGSRACRPCRCSGPSPGGGKNSTGKTVGPRDKRMARRGVLPPGGVREAEKEAIDPRPVVVAKRVPRCGCSRQSTVADAATATSLLR